MIDCKNKISGLLVPAFALRRDGDLGVGDTRAVQDAVDFCQSNGIAVLQLLPINETGGDNSPYNAISSVALDPLLLCCDHFSLPWLTKAQYECVVAESALADTDLSVVSYRVVKPLKLDLLRLAYDGFRRESGNSIEHKHFVSFKDSQKDWLKDYVLFRTLVDVHEGNASWTQWGESLSSPALARQWLLDSPKREELEQSLDFYSFMQWQAFKQWGELRQYAERSGVRLMGDIPFGVSRYSVDVWSRPELFDLKWSGGAPPEPFFQSDVFTAKWGQNWGIPIYRWDAHEAEDFHWWRQRIGRLTDIFHYFRIDHVLGFFRVYSFPWIPERNEEFVNLDKEEAAELSGGLLPRFLPRADQPEENAELNAAEGTALLEMIIAAAGSNGGGVVAEDLGVVPDYVRPILNELGVPGFVIPIFERDEETREFRDKETYNPLSLATYGTHDHQPLKLFYKELVANWHGPDGHEYWLDVQRLMRFLGLDDENPPLEFSEDLHRVFIDQLIACPSWLTVFMLPDLLGTEERFNMPGLASSENWSQRLDKPIRDYETVEPHRSRLKFLRQKLSENDRFALSSDLGKKK